MQAAHTAPDLAQGVLHQTLPDGVVLALPGTDYQIHLLTPTPLQPQGPAKTLTGRIAARARRVDVVRTGGRFIEPVYGRPRRVQGSVVAVDSIHNTLTVHCAPQCAFTCTLTDPRQKPADFTPGQIVSFDIERGASLLPV